MKRFSWAEMMRYWETHATVRAPIDPLADPDGLGNVCLHDAPNWLNRYYAQGQRFVFNRMLSRVPNMDKRPIRALDVGCGTARWSTILASHGYSTVGIDLQQSLIEANKQRYPWIRFLCVPIQEFDSKEQFHLISSVTVLQHLPPDEQSTAIQSMARLLHAGGHMLVLENVSDQGPHVFANKPAIWIHKFENEGLRCIYSYRYDYNPALRAASAVASFVQWVRGQGSAEVGGPETYAISRTHVATRTRVGNAVKRLAVMVDCLIDPILVRSQAPFTSKHCGFLLTKPSGGHP